MIEEAARQLKEAQPNKFYEKFITGPDLHEFFKKTLGKGWMVKGIIPESSRFNAIYGPPESFKSFLALDLFASVASGTRWHGRAVKKRPVLYIAAEGQSGVLKRLEAWKRYHGVETLDAFTLLPIPCLIDNKQELDAFISALENLPEMPGVIVLDTLARSMSGDENSTSDMGKVVLACTIVSEITGAQVIIVHHTGKDETRGARGSIALTGATDTMFRTVKIDTRQVALICERQKDDEPAPELIFDMEIVDTELVDADRNPVTSLVPVLNPDASRTKKTRKAELKGAARIGMAALEMALKEHGEPASEEVRQRMVDERGVVLQDDKVVHEDLWREFAYQSGVSEGDSNAKRQAFKRIRTKLINLGKVKCWNGFYWKC
jgi:hypothetical protein